MKFKLVEGFGYTQSALNASEQASEALDNFLIDVDLIIEGNKYLAEKDVNTLIEAKNILDKFHKEYLTFAKEKANEFYKEKNTK